MTCRPKTISKDKLAIEALNVMKAKIFCLVVVENESGNSGTIKLQDIIEWE